MGLVPTIPEEGVTARIPEPLITPTGTETTESNVDVTDVGGGVTTTPTEGETKGLNSVPGVAVIVKVLPAEAMADVVPAAVGEEAGEGSVWWRMPSPAMDYSGQIGAIPDHLVIRHLQEGALRAVSGLKPIPPSPAPQQQHLLIPLVPLLPFLSRGIPLFPLQRLQGPRLQQTQPDRRILHSLLPPPIR